MTPRATSPEAADRTQADSADATSPQRAIDLTLVAHTNAGKTTLARTLLGRDVGEVRDAAHVTLESATYPLLATAHGDTLTLTDTPGFGDSARLARRLAQHGNPIGWFLEQLWDRWRDRPLWLAQQAVRSVRERADVVLYLVNASETPEDAGYLGHELDVLAWVGKPVIVLLNQTGAPQPLAALDAEVQRWRPALVHRAFVVDVLPLDAFTRHWVQEGTLLQAIGRALPAGRRDAFARLVQAWQARRETQLAEAMQALAGPIARAAADRERAPPSTLRDMGRELWREVAGRGPGVDGVQARATAAMAARVEADLAAATDRLLAVHALEGQARGEVLARIAQSVDAQEPMHEGKAAILGGFVSGALSGVAADLASGGLTLGAGLLAGGLLGALGGAGLARGVNVARGTTGTTVRWTDAFLESLVAACLLRYLAVSHFGRGRGAWSERDEPAFWQEQVQQAIVRHRSALQAAWQSGVDVREARVREALEDLTRDLLDALYPGTASGHAVGH